MVVFKAAYNLMRIDRCGIIQCDAECFRRLNPLQNIHVIGHNRAILSFPESIVPATPCFRLTRQHTDICMQYNIIGLIGNGAENFCL